MVKMGDVWDRTIEFLGDNLSILLPIVILGLFVPTSISGSLEDLRQIAGPGLRAGLALLSLIFAIVALWVQLGIVALAVDPTIGRRASRVATARLLPVIGVTLVALIVLVLLSLPIVILLTLGGMDFAAAQNGQLPAVAPGYGAAAFFYALAFVLAIIAVGARMMPLSAVIVAERRGVGAFARAFRMTRGLTWRLIGVVLLYVIVAAVAVGAARAVFGSILLIVAGGDGPITVASVITAIVVAAVSAALTTIAAGFVGKLYVAIQRRDDALAPPRAESGATYS